MQISGRGLKSRSPMRLDDYTLTVERLDDGSVELTLLHGGQPLRWTMTAEDADLTGRMFLGLPIPVQDGDGDVNQPDCQS